MVDLCEGVIAVTVDEGRMSLPKVMLFKDGEGQHGWTQLIATASGQSFNFPFFPRRDGEACSGSFWFSLIALESLKESSM